MSALAFPRFGSRLRAVWDRLENPVLGREFRSRMRGGRSYLITGTYTLLVAACVLITYWWLTSAAHWSSPNQRAAELGRGIWTWGCLAQAMLLPLIVPAFTCGAITLEREREMLELLLLTRQSPLQICTGKLGSGVGLGLVLIAASLPVLSLAMVLGGVAPSEMFACVVVLASTVIASGTLGLVASCVAQRTVVATSIAYLLVGFGLVGLPILLSMVSAAQSISESGSEWGILAMLAALLAFSFPPAVGISLGTVALRRRRGADPPARHWWFLMVGLTWAGLLLFLYLPGTSGLLLHGYAVLMFHPVTTLLGVLQPEMGSGLPSYHWLLCAFCYLGVAAWLFYVSVLRVRRLRVG